MEHKFDTSLLARDGNAVWIYADWCEETLRGGEEFRATLAQGERGFSDGNGNGDGDGNGYGYG
jgi:hypothetical protein